MAGIFPEVDLGWWPISYANRRRARLSWDTTTEVLYAAYPDGSLRLFGYVTELELEPLRLVYAERAETETLEWVAEWARLLRLEVRGAHR